MYKCTRIAYAFEQRDKHIGNGDIELSVDEHHLAHMIVRNLDLGVEFSNLLLDKQFSNTKKLTITGKNTGSYEGKPYSYLFRAIVTASLLHVVDVKISSVIVESKIPLRIKEHIANMISWGLKQEYIKEEY